MSTIAFSAPQLARPSAPVRLTRRGRVVVVAAALFVLAFAMLLLGPSVVATGDAGVPQQTRSVTLMAGQTLWQIAADANPEGDIRDTVDDIVELNALPNASAVTAGTTIAVPVY